MNHEISSIHIPSLEVLYFGGSFCVSFFFNPKMNIATDYSSEMEKVKGLIFLAVLNEVIIFKISHIFGEQIILSLLNLHP